MRRCARKGLVCKVVVCCLVVSLGMPFAGYCANDEIGELIEQLGNPRDEWKLREQAVRALVQKRSKAVDALIEALKKGRNYRVRRSAAEALGYIRDTQAIKPLIGAMGEKDEYVRGSAATALVQIGTASVEPLIEALGSKSWMVRQNAAWALGEIGDKKAAAAVGNLAKSDPDTRVRPAAESALWLLK